MGKKATTAGVSKAFVKQVIENVALTNREVLAMKASLEHMLHIPLPAPTSFRMAQLGQAVQQHLAPLEKTRNDLVKQYGGAIEGKAGQFKVPEEHMDTFNEAWSEVLDIEVSIPAIHISLPADMELEPGILMGLLSFVDIDGMEDVAPSPAANGAKERVTANA